MSKYIFVIIVLFSCLQISAQESIKSNKDLNLYYSYNFNSEYPKIGIYNFTTKKTKEFIPEGKSSRGQYGASISPDQSTVVMNTYHFGGWKLAFTNSSGKNMRKAVSSTNAYAYYASFSPNGNWIVYSGAVSGRTGSYEIFKVNTEYGERIRLTNGEHWNYKPQFSNDGKNICYTYFDYDSKQYEIYTINSDGSNIINVTNNSSQDFSGSYSPDNTKIAFLSTRSGSINLHIINLKTGNVKQLTEFSKKYQPKSDFNDLEWAYGTSWSRTGKIAFTVKNQGNLNIYIIDDNGNNLIKLDNGKNASADPKWDY